MEMKICSQCKVKKPLTIEFFGIQNKKKSGFRSYCKECSKKYNGSKKKYYQMNKEKIAIYKKKYILENKKKISEQRKKFRNLNKERLNKETSKWRKENRERHLESQKKYYYKNRKIKIMQSVEYQSKRYKNDINFRIVDNLRNRIHKSLKGNTKSKKSIELIGCNSIELKRYLESKFQEGMTWDNYGLHGWHIDHIIPCASFDLTDPEQQKICFHYSNLQPLWAKENLSKSDKVEETQLNLLLDGGLI